MNHSAQNVPPAQKIATAAILCLILMLHLKAFFDPGAVTAGVYFLLCVAVMVARRWRLLHCAALFFLMSVLEIFPFTVNLPALGLLISLIVSFAVVLPFKPARASLAWLSAGSIDTAAAVLLVLTGLVSSAVLIGWANWTDNLGIGVQMIQGVSGQPRLLIFFIGIPVFAAINAATEEVIYRGVLQEALAVQVKSPALTVLLQSAAFAALHYTAGFPNGVIGYGMVFGYGVMLGHLRIRTGGMLAPFLAHMVADLTIFYYMAFKFL